MSPVLRRIARHVGLVRTSRPAKRHHRARQVLAGVAAVTFAVLCAVVFERDGYCCRACGAPVDTTAPKDDLSAAHPHHIVWRSKSGADTTVNVCTLCARCHAQAHGQDGARLIVAGDADHQLTFTRASRSWSTYPMQESRS